MKQNNIAKLPVVGFAIVLRKEDNGGRSIGAVPLTITIGLDGVDDFMELNKDIVLGTVNNANQDLVAVFDIGDDNIPTHVGYETLQDSIDWAAYVEKRRLSGACFSE